MTIKVREVVEGAIRRLGVLGTGQPMSAEMAQKTLTALNGMMHAWQAKGLSYVHGTMTLDSFFPLGEVHEEGVKALLALRMSDDYAPEAATPQLRRDAREGWAILCGAFWDTPGSGNDLPRNISNTTTARSLP